MSPHYFAEAAAQRLYIQLARHAQGAGDVVSRATGLKLIEKPQPLLCEGERYRPSLISRRNDVSLSYVLNALFFE
jgi:hypothetical protein